MEPQFISPPLKFPWYLRIGLRIARKKTGKDLLPAKILAHFPKAAISSGIMESLVAHGPKDMDARLLQLVRLKVSLTANCAFCIDMNGVDYEKNQITPEEFKSLQGTVDPNQVTTFSDREKTAIAYAGCITQTPLEFPQGLLDHLKVAFTEKEIVILATTAAQVNYWTRLIQAFRVPPAGFSDVCSLTLERD
jgi:AhpD family alkylhydroperoxidase